MWRERPHTESLQATLAWCLGDEVSHRRAIFETRRNCMHAPVTVGLARPMKVPAAAPVPWTRPSAQNRQPYVQLEPEHRPVEDGQFAAL